ncbi:CU044_5270 family protein [Amycolatopsis sp. NPDC051061]|uniref:CU044_5270 family protein n=1 Tax=Amycolatopsis sp. NPDC051061 TaxID=3155042 RepID=UPI00342082B0
MTPGDTEADDDASVIARSRQEPSLFAVIFDRHARHIHRYVVRRLGPTAADDVLADTFLIAFGKRAQFDLSRPDARPWLYGIATNLVSRQWRAEVRELKLRLAAGAPAVDDGHADRVADRVSAQALGADLDRALAALRPRERDVLLLVLTEAAGAALEEPAKAPRPDQFLYVRTENPDHHIREVWLSVDGTRDGLIGDTEVTGCHDGKAPYSGPDPAKKRTLEDCGPSPAYRADLPTTADAMLAYLAALPGTKDGDVSSMGKKVFMLAYERALTPASYAALFQAAAKVPGLKALDHVTDGAGRPGVGITWPHPPGSAPGAKPIVLVFDARTHQFLGTDDSAVTVKTFVDEAGQRP